jgi:hypothetical protein
MAYRKLWHPGRDEEDCINHFGIVIDESYSMKKHQAAVVKVADGIVAHLADRSKFYDQETRLTVYTFSERGGERCLFYDKDVLRMPSLEGLYSPRSQTALIDCALLAIGDLAATAQLYGLHAMMIYLVTDGIENDSITRPIQLSERITRLPENWTVAGLVPDQQGVFDLKKCGVPGGNIAVWDTTSVAGMERVGDIIRDTSDAFMAGRKRGVHGYSSASGSPGLFQLRDFSAQEVKAVAPPLTAGSYVFYDVAADERIDEFVARVTGRPYQVGKAFYQLTPRKTVLVQGYKGVAVEAGGALYAGDGVRRVLGLPDTAQKLKGDQKADCVIFIQSTSHNRKLLAGTKLLILR